MAGWVWFFTFPQCFCRHSFGCVAARFHYAGCGGDKMEDQTIFQKGTIHITTKIARFGATTYQVANIGSVGTFIDRKFNIIAIVLFVVTVVAAFVAYDMYGKHYGEPQVAPAIAGTSLVAAVLLQMFWPRKVFTFVLKTSSNDVHKIVSEDGEFLESVQGAVETAFVNN
jgi:hypothetical protein